MIACSLFPAGCGSTGTDLNQLVNESTFPDGGSDGASGASGGDGSASGNGTDGSTAGDPFAGAPAYAAQMGSSTHNAGKSCVAAGCHAPPGVAGAPPFSIGGTVYTDYLGQTPAPGVEVRILDSSGHATSVYSGPEGNFYLVASSSSSVAFPAVVGARNASATRLMITPLASSSGSCGQSNCHIPGGGSLTGTGNYYPIHVP
jgi:hypothetical protein